MDTRRTRNLRNNTDKTILDKQVDKIFETGRQFVDGVSGARPGKRKNSDFQMISRRNVKNVGKWVTDKMDMFFEEDDDWYDDEERYDELSEIKSFKRESRTDELPKTLTKRPLEALSLRQTKDKQRNEQKNLPYGKSNTSDEWPDDSDLKVDRWQRNSKKDNHITFDEDNQRSSLSNGRSLPRSRRRRI